MDVVKLKKTILTTVGAVLGGGIAGSVAALADPAKYRFPHDLGTGKMWPFFLSGAGLTLGGMVLHSPMGQKVLAGISQTQQQIEQSKKDIAQAKVEMKGGANGPKGDGKSNPKP